MIKLLQPVSACLLLLTMPVVMAKETALIAVAANFSPVAEELGQKFSADTGRSIRISTAASGTLVRQIQRGAPFELFLSADEDHVQLLDREGYSIDAGIVYAVGVLVLFIPYTSSLDRMQNISDMMRVLVSARTLKLALANPATAPYGRTARQVIHRFAQDNTESQVIIGENVGQAAQFALTGNVDAAFIPLSLALDNAMQSAGHFELIPADWHTPIRQRMVLMKNAGVTARSFYQYLLGKAAQDIIRKYGYSLPGEN